MRFFEPEHVQFPPHPSLGETIRPENTKTQLSDKISLLRLEPEAEVLLSQLPYLTAAAAEIEVGNDPCGMLVGTDMFALSYLQDVDDARLIVSRDPFGLEQNDIPPWAIRLTFGLNNGMNDPDSWVYDIRERGFLSTDQTRTWKPHT